MRITTAQKKFIHDYWKTINPTNQVYLFGSRVDDQKKGGDIDILVLSEIKLHHTVLFKMKQLFFSKFGEQKMDVVNFTSDQESAFKKYILSYAKLLNDE